MSDRWYITEEAGYRRPVTVVNDDDDGRIAVPHGPVFQAKSGRHYRQDVYREGQVVPAEPGWYALCACKDFDGDVDIRRLPIVAWELDEWGDCYVINGYIGDGGDCPVERLRGTNRLTPVFICHPERLPEPDDAEDQARQEAR